MSLQIQDIDASVDLLAALLWRHDNAENLTALLTKKQEWYAVNQSGFWDDWYRDVFDIRTANDFGRAVWAIILGVPLNKLVSQVGTSKPTWGFSRSNRNFGHGNFTAVGSTSVALPAEQQRAILQLRYLSITGRNTIPELNRIMAYVFRNEGPVYVLDGLDMTITYVFNFEPSPFITFIINNLYLLPRPAAVRVKYIVASRPAFGFGVYNKNFDNSNFAAPLI